MSCRGLLSPQFVVGYTSHHSFLMLACGAFLKISFLSGCLDLFAACGRKSGEFTKGCKAGLYQHKTAFLAAVLVLKNHKADVQLQWEPLLKEMQQVFMLVDISAEALVSALWKFL